MNPRGLLRHKCGDNNKLELKRNRMIHVAQDEHRWHPLVNTVMDFCVL
jgi:hypothetical protein